MTMISLSGAGDGPQQLQCIREKKTTMTKPALDAA